MGVIDENYKSRLGPNQNVKSFNEKRTSYCLLQLSVNMHKNCTLFFCKMSCLFFREKRIKLLLQEQYSWFILCVWNRLVRFWKRNNFWSLRCVFSRLPLSRCLHHRHEQASSNNNILRSHILETVLKDFVHADLCKSLTNQLLMSHFTRKGFK